MTRPIGFRIAKRTIKNQNISKVITNKIKILTLLNIIIFVINCLKVDYLHI